MPGFPKSLKILKNREFQGIFKEGRSFGNPYFGVRWIPKEKRRMGVSVSRKILNATQRNLIKRIVRECFRLNPDRFPMGDILVVAKPALNKHPRKNIWESLDKLLEKRVYGQRSPH